jgi:hypothetical protein
MSPLKGPSDSRVAVRSLLAIAGLRVASFATFGLPTLHLPEPLIHHCRSSWYSNSTPACATVPPAICCLCLCDGSTPLVSLVSCVPPRSNSTTSILGRFINCLLPGYLFHCYLGRYTALPLIYRLVQVLETSHIKTRGSAQDYMTLLLLLCRRLPPLRLGSEANANSYSMI